MVDAVSDEWPIWVPPTMATSGSDTPARPTRGRSPTGHAGQLVVWENGYGGASGDDWHADRLVGRYEYSPFGEVVGPDDDADGDWRDDAGAFATDNPFRFSTKWHDDAIGVSDFGARMYSATLARFLNRDPIAEAGGVNLYAFAGNDPVNRVDPFGYYLVPCPNPGGCGELGSQLPVIGGGVPLPGAGGDGNVSGNCADMLCPTGWPATYCPTTGRCECPEAGCGGFGSRTAVFSSRSGAREFNPCWDQCNGLLGPGVDDLKCMCVNKCRTDRCLWQTVECFSNSSSVVAYVLDIVCAHCARYIVARNRPTDPRAWVACIGSCAGGLVQTFVSLKACIDQNRACEASAQVSFDNCLSNVP